jgi:hypothetical protein
MLVIPPVANPERDTDRLVVPHVDLGRKGELPVIKVTLQLLQKRQNVALHSVLAVLEILATLLGMLNS